MTRLTPALLLTLACACLPGCAADPVNSPAAAAPPDNGPVRVQPFDITAYSLSAGDSVRIDVLGEPELSMAALIEPAGNINYPFLGHVRAAGLTVKQLEQQIAAGLRKGYLKSPDVRVSIAHYRPIFVTGQVRQTGAYPYTLGLRVDQALTLAGGITQFASTRRIYVQRSGASQEQRERVELDSPVYPGDTIVVEERLF